MLRTWQNRFLCTSALVIVAVGWLLPAATFARAPLSNDPSRLAECQDVVRAAALRLGNQVRRRLGRCVERGLPCILRSGNPRTCCAIAGFGCASDLRKIETELVRFTRKVERRGCEDVSLDAILEAAGLGYREIAGVCGQLQPPVTIASLADLRTCLGRAVWRDNGRALATIEVPRGCEALRCMGFDDIADAICTVAEGPMETDR